MPTAYEEAERILKIRESEQQQDEINRKVREGIEQFKNDFMNPNIRQKCPLAEIEDCLTKGSYSQNCSRCTALSQLLSAIAYKPGILEQNFQDLVDEKVNKAFEDLKVNIQSGKTNIVKEILEKSLDLIISEITESSEPTTRQLELLSDETLKIVTAALLLRDNFPSIFALPGIEEELSLNFIELLKDEIIA